MPVVARAAWRFQRNTRSWECGAEERGCLISEAQMAAGGPMMPCPVCGWQPGEVVGEDAAEEIRRRLRAAGFDVAEAGQLATRIDEDYVREFVVPTTTMTTTPNQTGRLTTNTVDWSWYNEWRSSWPAVTAPSTADAEYWAAITEPTEADRYEPGNVRRRIQEAARRLRGLPPEPEPAPPAPVVPLSNRLRVFDLED